MIITPGYDFGAHEVPTHAKLEQMVDGMSITGIDIDQIDSTLIGIKVGETDVSLPAAGWLRSDALNALWVRGTHGDVQIYRANYGGLESRGRFPFKGRRYDTAFGTSAQRSIAHGYLYFDASDTRPSICEVYPTPGHTPCGIKILETAWTSESLTWPRIVLRGGFEGIALNETNNRNGWVEYFNPNNGAGVSTYGIIPRPQTNKTLPIGGVMTAQVDRTQGAAIINSTFLGWLFGLNLQAQ